MDHLSHLSVLTVSGSDAREFLQGQMTQNIEDINDEMVFLTSFCNPKGRVLATAFIQYWNKAYYLILNAELIEDLHAWLSRYIMRSDVKINIDGISVFGVDEEMDKQNDFLLLSDSHLQTLRRLVNDNSRFLLLSSIDLPTRYGTMSEHDWKYEDFSNGIPIINKASSLKYIPQMLNLHELGAISFSKGCYTGQEVVAKVQHRGKIKQKLVWSVTSGNIPLETQADVMNGEQKVGTLATVLYDHEMKENYCLAVVNTIDADADLTIKIN
ncbi:MAG: hypothetical protein P8L74_03290 [Gammaproteobacteria bacterium]|nr:hypothetical protein [Gammaproteobacteria bacterium]